MHKATEEMMRDTVVRAGLSPNDDVKLLKLQYETMCELKSSKTADSNVEETAEFPAVDFADESTPALREHAAKRGLDSTTSHEILIQTLTTYHRPRECTTLSPPLLLEDMATAELLERAQAEGLSVTPATTRKVLLELLSPNLDDLSTADFCSRAKRMGLPADGTPRKQLLSLLSAAAPSASRPASSSRLSLPSGKGTAPAPPAVTPSAEDALSKLLGALAQKCQRKRKRVLDSDEDDDESEDDGPGQSFRSGPGNEHASHKIVLNYTDDAAKYGKNIGKMIRYLPDPPEDMSGRIQLYLMEAKRVQINKDVASNDPGLFALAIAAFTRHVDDQLRDARTFYPVHASLRMAQEVAFHNTWTRFMRTVEQSMDSLDASPEQRRLPIRICICNACGITVRQHVESNAPT